MSRKHNRDDDGDGKSDPTDTKRSKSGTVVPPPADFDPNLFGIVKQAMSHDFPVECSQLIASYTKLAIRPQRMTSDELNQVVKMVFPGAGGYRIDYNEMLRKIGNPILTSWDLGYVVSYIYGLPGVPRYDVKKMKDHLFGDEDSYYGKVLIRMSWPNAEWYSDEIWPTDYWDACPWSESFTIVGSHGQELKLCMGEIFDCKIDYEYTISKLEEGGTLHKSKGILEEFMTRKRVLEEFAAREDGDGDDDGYCVDYEEADA